MPEGDHHMQRYHYITAGLMFLLLAGCGSTGGSETETAYYNAPVLENTAVAFSPGAMQSENVFSLQLVSASPDGVLEFMLPVHPSPSIGHMDFVLTHDTSVLRFVSARTVLPAARKTMQTTMYASGYEAQPGEVFMEIRTTTDHTAVPLSGIVLEYEVIGLGSSSLRFVQASVLSSSGAPLYTPWAGGVVAVRHTS